MSYNKMSFLIQEYNEIGFNFYTTTFDLHIKFSTSIFILYKFVFKIPYLSFINLFSKYHIKNLIYTYETQVQNSMPVKNSKILCDLRLIIEACMIRDTSYFCVTTTGFAIIVKNSLFIVHIRNMKRSKH